MIRSVILLGLLATLFTGCSSKNIDKCYVDIQRYDTLKNIFLETGSMQRVEQVMEEEKWAKCEREQVRYQLSKDLSLEDLKSESQ